MQIPLVESRLALSYSSWFSDLGFAFFVRWLRSAHFLILAEDYMKFGVRKPSIKRSISARTTGKLKRTVNRTILLRIHHQKITFLRNRVLVMSSVCAEIGGDIHAENQNFEKAGKIPFVKAKKFAKKRKYFKKTIAKSKIYGIIILLCSVVTMKRSAACSHERFIIYIF